MKNDYITRAEKFIVKFYPYIKGLRDNFSIERAIDKFNNEHKQQVLYRHGAARRAFITSDYVIKVDYGNGKSWAGGCEDEYRRYHEIFSKSEYSYLFAPISKFNYCRKTFYIMPRIKGVGTGKYYGNLTFAERKYIGWNVNDLHQYNYGHYKRKPVIIDYAMGDI